MVDRILLSFIPGSIGLFDFYMYFTISDASWIWLVAGIVGLSGSAYILCSKDN